MSPQPFRCELRRGVLLLTLDTPGSQVNIFTPEAASHLIDILTRTPTSDLRAVLLRSGKQGSFVNGVGLMIAGSAKSAEDLASATRVVRQAYSALRDYPVPTIAAIDGNCYGCGVELALQCRYRLATDTFDTNFRMTEISDYLFIPTFGGTQDLPHLLGLDVAAEFVLWGRRWSAREALEAGLVDRCVAPGETETEAERFIDALSQRPAPDHRDQPQDSASRARPARSVESYDRHRDRIRRLPPAYRQVYATALDLMMRAATKGFADVCDYELEATEAAASLLAPPCRGAWPFFFIRQIARTLALADVRKPTGVVLEAADERLLPLCDELTSRCAPWGWLGAPARDAGSPIQSGAVERIRLEPSEVDGPFGQRDVGPEDSLIASLAISSERLQLRRGAILHVPLRGLGVEVAEVALAGDRPSRAASLLAAALAEKSYTVVRSRPDGRFVVDELIAAWLAPQIRYLDRGGKPADLACSLRTFGFMRLAGDWVDGLGADALCKLVRDRLNDVVDPMPAIRALPRAKLADGQDDPSAVAALHVSLGAFAARVLRARCLPHPAAVDVLARDVVDFPLQHTSLCRFLTLSTGRRLLQMEGSLRHLTSEEDFSSLKEFVAHGREYYLGVTRGS